MVRIPKGHAMGERGSGSMCGIYRRRLGAPMYISDSYLEELISEDVPSVDLTTHVLGIGGATAA